MFFSLISLLFHLFLIGLSFATGKIVSGSPLVCGGVSGHAHDECYFMNMKTKSWIFLTKMATKRWGSASAVVNESLLVTGGLARLQF